MNKPAAPLSASDWCDRALHYLRAYINHRVHWVRAWDEPLSHDEYLAALREATERPKRWDRAQKILLLMHARGWAAAYYRQNTAGPILDDADESYPVLMLLNTITARAAGAADERLRDAGFTVRPTGIPALRAQGRQQHLEVVMRQYGGRASWSEIAQLAGVSRATLYRMLDRKADRG